MKLTPSKHSDDPSFQFREQLFTPWMSADVLQESTQRAHSFGMIPLYSEYEPEKGFREIFWTPPGPTFFEVRSARTFDEFLDIAKRNLENGHCLSTLQISSDNLFSSTWLSEEAVEHAAGTLAALGITAATIEMDL